jgi:hypothetical protein
MVIGLTGLMNSGKSTVADYLVTHREFTRLKFATGLKVMMEALGLSYEEIEGVLKELPSEKLNGRTPRYAMQTLGTEWGRTCMGQDFWVNLLVQRAHRMEFGTNIVIDDVRFPNEAVAVQRDLQGKVWRLVRHGGIGFHASEHEQVWITPDLTINNQGTLDELLEKVELMVSSEHH